MTFRTREAPGGTYAARRCGSTGHEIIDPQGKVVAWTVDGAWAAVIVTLFSMTDGEGPPAVGDVQRQMSP
jgi:hypothetical protein